MWYAPFHHSPNVVFQQWGSSFQATDSCFVIQSVRLCLWVRKLRPSIFVLLFFIFSFIRWFIYAHFDFIQILIIFFQRFNLSHSHQNTLAKNWSCQLGLSCNGIFTSVIVIDYFFFKKITVFIILNIWNVRVRLNYNRVMLLPFIHPSLQMQFSLQDKYTKYIAAHTDRRMITLATTKWSDMLPRKHSNSIQVLLQLHNFCAEKTMIARHILIC